MGFCISGTNEVGAGRSGAGRDGSSAGGWRCCGALCCAALRCAALCCAGTASVAAPCRAAARREAMERLLLQLPESLGLLAAGTPPRQPSLTPCPPRLPPASWRPSLCCRLAGPPSSPCPPPSSPPLSSPRPCGRGPGLPVPAGGAGPPTHPPHHPPAPHPPAHPTTWPPTHPRRGRCLCLHAGLGAGHLPPAALSSPRGKLSPCAGQLRAMPPSLPPFAFRVVSAACNPSLEGPSSSRARPANRPLPLPLPPPPPPPPQEPAPGRLDWLRRHCAGRLLCGALRPAERLGRADHGQH